MFTLLSKVHLQWKKSTSFKEKFEFPANFMEILAKLLDKTAARKYVTENVFSLNWIHLNCVKCYTQTHFNIFSRYGDDNFPI